MFYTLQASKNEEIPYDYIDFNNMTDCVSIISYHILYSVIIHYYCWVIIFSFDYWEVCKVRNITDTMIPNLVKIIDNTQNNYLFFYKNK